MFQNKNIWRLFLLLVVSAIAVTKYLVEKRGLEGGYSIYYEISDQNLPERIPFQFISSHENIWKKIHHASTSLDAGNASSDLLKFTPPPSVSVCPLNDDHHPDLLLSGDRTVRVFLNEEGTNWKEESTKLQKILSEITTAWWGPVLCHDFNRDGLTDLLLTPYESPHFILIQKPGQTWTKISFSDQNYIYRPESFGIFDFDHDAQWDVVYGNFLANPEEMLQSPSKDHWAAPARYDNKTGGKNVLFKGYWDEQKRSYQFALYPDADFKTRSYTHSVGLADLNQDGWIDIFFANDYAHDELFINKEGRTVIPWTNPVFPKYLHGLSGMNSDFCDINEDLIPDLYVTNNYKPPFYTSYNLLWLSQGTPLQYEEVGDKVGVGRCGFSWGAKCVDFDRDGLKDIVVTNGKSRHPAIESPGDGISFWYRRALGSRTLRVLNEDPFVWQSSTKPMYASAFENDCFFYQYTSGKFINVAKQVGIEDSFEGKGLATADFDNDGRIDVFITNTFRHPLQYQNESQTTYPWLGIELRDRYGSKIQPGAAIELLTKENQVLLRDQIFPWNGYSAQSDYRVVLTLTQRIIEQVTHLQIQWPLTRKKQKIALKELSMNKYNQIDEIRGVVGSY